jgi:predicted O-methyltransferase YrrM
MAEKWSRFSGERILLGARRFFGAAWVCTKFNTIYALAKPGKANTFAQGVLGLNDTLLYNDKVIPQLEVWKAFPGIEDIDVTIGRVLPTEGSSISTYETLVLGGIVKYEKAKRIFEIGTSHGLTSYNLARNLPDDGVLFTLDLPPKEDVGGDIQTHFKVTNSDAKMIFSDRKTRRFCGTHIENRIQQLYGDSAMFDYSPYEKSIDIVFVDGSHAYDYVKSDTMNALRIVKPGGLIIWHDYNDGYFWPDVHKYLKEFAVEQRQPVKRVAGTMHAILRLGAGSQGTVSAATGSGPLSHRT